jgi:DNA repair ATPase RecN
MGKEISKNELQLVGMENRDIVISNEILFKFSELKKDYEKQLKQFKETLEDLNEQLWFLEVSKKDTPKEEEKYNEIRTQKIKATNQAIETHNRAIKELEGLVEKSNSFLENINNHINIRIEGDNSYAEYDKSYFHPLIELATNIGWIDYEEVLKKQEKESKKA